jgi:hypothetical protein
LAKKKTGKEVKRLKKKAKKLTAANLMLQKRIQKLKKKLGARKHQDVVDLQAGYGEAAIAIAAEIGAYDGGGIASSHRASWKQHKYLRDRYELHLGAGATKECARQFANDDLKKEFGTDKGFSEEQLSAILS